MSAKYHSQSLAEHHLKIPTAQNNKNRTNHTAGTAKEMGMGRPCASHDTYSAAESRRQINPRWPQKEMSSVRNMEEHGGKRDEGQRLDMGPRETISSRPKLVAISSRDLMCTYALRGLKKTMWKPISFSLPSLFDQIGFGIQTTHNYDEVSFWDFRNE